MNSKDLFIGINEILKNKKIIESIRVNLSNEKIYINHEIDKLHGLFE